MKNYQPDLVSYFPRTRRGHGRGLGRPVPPNSKVHERKKQNCQVSSCVVNGGKEAHAARDANIEDWEAERGIKLFDLTLPRIQPLRRAA